MATREKPPRSWEVDDLLDLGRREGEKGKYLKATPVLILEEWVRGKRQKDVANYVRTKPTARRIVRNRLRPPFKDHGTGAIFGSLTSIQKSRNLTRPHLIKNRGGGMFEVNLPHYEPLLQEYRQEYRKLYPEDYRKLFPKPEEEPEWERLSLPKKRAGRGEAKPTPLEPEMQDEIDSLLAQLEQSLRNQRHTVERLTEEKQKLQAELDRRTQENADLKEQLDELSRRELTYLSTIKKGQTSARYSLPPDDRQDLLESLERSLSTHRKNLYAAREKKAKYGLNPPMEILNEIEHAEEEMKRIKAEIAYFENQQTVTN